ncbi:MAG: hypothetical protein LBE22_10325 [Azoarcus sp.]|jgi:predicted histidine transporter YuiF (NhaC family)|nr:hypothetical protein [Azoarcus sp.]
MSQIQEKLASAFGVITATAAGMTIDKWLGLLGFLFGVLIPAIFLYRRDRRGKIESAAKVAALDSQTRLTDTRHKILAPLVETLSSNPSLSLQDVLKVLRIADDIGNAGGEK